jgi:hypothetical protein
VTLSSYCIDAGHLIADALATLIGVAKAPSDNWIAFAVQCSIETANGTSTGADKFNPLNLTTAGGTIVWPGQTGTWGGGDTSEWHEDFAAFGSLQAGAWACAANYANGEAYGEVRWAFLGGNPIAIAKAIEDSPWDTGHYQQRLDEAVQEQLEEGTLTEDQVKALISEALKIPLLRIEALEGRPTNPIPPHEHTGTVTVK